MIRVAAGNGTAARIRTLGRGDECLALDQRDTAAIAPLRGDDIVLTVGGVQ